jgi:SAM-dependent methyltransferase
MLQKAQQVLRTGRLSYDRRRIGIVYDAREFAVEMPAAGEVDFWACDALALPFQASQFGAVLALNLFDCVASPRDLLAVIGGMLRTGAGAVIASPYDWSTSATPVEAWIGGHSQRGENEGAAEPLLRTLLTPGAHPQSVEGLEITAEADDVVWETRLHDRSRVSYDTHVVAARAT